MTTRTQHPTPTTTHAGDRALRLRHPSVNISPVERADRITVGAAVVISAAIWITSATSTLHVLLLALLMLAGLDLLVTGGLGDCPPYATLGHTPVSRRWPR